MNRLLRTTRLEMLEDRTTPAAVGGLDLPFGTSGLVDVAFDLAGSKADTANAVAVQQDGKILVVGSAQNGPTDVDFAITRLNANGTLDTSFGSKGIVAIGFDLGGSNIDRATSVVVQNDGRILVAGFAQIDAAGDYDFAIARLTATGELDAAFDTDGRQTIAFDFAGSTNDDRATGISLDANGRIVVVGTVARATAGDTDFGIARLNSDGSLDAAFDIDGRQTVGFDLGGTNADAAAGLVVLSDNRIIVAGSAAVTATGDVDYAIARLLENGALDSGFDTDGKQSIAFDLGGKNIDEAAALAVDANGSIVVVGTVENGTTGDRDVGVARLLSDGKLDATFDTDGQLALGFDLGGTNQDRAAGVVIERGTNRIVIAATVDLATPGDTDFAVARFLPDGSLDASFDADGRAVVAFDRGSSNVDRAAGIALTPDGRIVVAGTIDTTTAGDTDIGVARLISSTSLANRLAVGGRSDGTAALYDLANSQYVQTGNIATGAPATIRTVIADVNGDGFDDTITGFGPGGGSRVRIALGIDPAIAPVALVPAPTEFDAFEAGFSGGVFLAAGDIDGDGMDELAVSPDVGGGGRVQIYSFAANAVVRRDNFFGIDDPAFRGGARVAMGDVNGDGRADLVVGAGFLGGPRVAVFDGKNLGASQANPGRIVGDFFAFPGSDAANLRNGVFVTVGDVNGDGMAELIFGGGPGGGPRVYALDGQRISSGDVLGAQSNPVANFFVAGNDAARGGVRLAVKDIDGDNFADLVAASGENQLARVRVYRGSTVTQPNGMEPPLFQEFDPFGTAIAEGVFVG